MLTLVDMTNELTGLSERAQHRRYAGTTSAASRKSATSPLVLGLGAKKMSLRSAGSKFWDKGWWGGNRTGRGRAVRGEGRTQEGAEMAADSATVSYGPSQAVASYTGLLSSVPAQ